MKSSKLPDFEREMRREDIMYKRRKAIVDHRRRGVSYVKSKTTAFPFSSTRQNARYARQIAAGQLRMAGV